MKPNQLPPEIVKLLPPPEVLDLFKLEPREKPEVMVETVASWIDLVADMITTEAWHQRLRESVRAAVLSGTLPALKVIEAARHNRDIDLALRQLLVVEGLVLPGDDAGATALRAYHDQALLRDITPGMVGRPEDTIMRDLGITTLMSLAMVRWPYLHKSVSPASKRPSASKIVAAALNRRRINITHHRVLKIFDTCDCITGRIIALFPA